MPTTPLASVLILTYKQEHLVGDTLRSVLAQKTDFPFEIVIGDDASPDGTVALCESIAAGDPRVRVLRHPVNMGHVGNFHATLAECRGRYVALLGGDDIWTDPTKLQRQVTFLRDHPDHLISHTHNDLLIHATGAVEARRRSSGRRDGDCFEMLARDGNFITASTVVFDQQALTDADKQRLRPLATEDYPLWLTLSKKGKIHFIPDACVRYRILDGSLGRPVNPSVERLIAAVNTNREICTLFCNNPEDRHLLPGIHARNDTNILRLLLNAGERNQARAFAKTIPWSRRIRHPRLLRYCLKAR